MEIKVYNGKVIQVTEEKIGEINWERAYFCDGVVVYPMTEGGKILLVQEKRPHESPALRLKALSGILEPDKGTPAENAQREMQEEIGFKAKTLTLLWEMKTTGTVNNTQYFYLAEGLVPSKLPNPDGEDSIVSLVELSLEEIKDKLFKNEIPWSAHTLGHFKLLHLKVKIS
jgi:8-oxo-dGTP pyrophosphatase MutT (NUDIX family)